jgi:hypothetical protein
MEVVQTVPEALLRRVDDLLDSARVGQQKLHENYVQIALAMLEVKNTKAFLARTHSWDKYILECGQRLGKKRTVLYSGISVAEQLGPYIAPKQLVSMGISKSQPLAAFVKQSGNKPSPALLEAANDPAVGVEEFRAKIATAQHLPANPKSKWRSIGFFCTDDEYSEIERAFALARREDEIDENLPETIVQFRTISCMAKECISSWEAK